jgi:hypothetical protein
MKQTFEADRWLELGYLIISVAGVCVLVATLP